MILVDSSGWLEFLTGGPLAGSCAPALKDLRDVITPTIVLYEVYKFIKRERGEEEALVAVGQMGKTRVVPLTDPVALTAADLSLKHKLAMADAIVYATAVLEGSKVLTCDADLADLPGVTFLKKS